MIRRQHNDEKRSGQLRRLGEVVDGFVDDLRFHRQVETLQNLGPRALGEFLVGISEQRAYRTFIEQRAVAHSRLDPEIVKELDGDKFSRRPLYEVKS